MWQNQSKAETIQKWPRLLRKQCSMLGYGLLFRNGKTTYMQTFWEIMNEIFQTIHRSMKILRIHEYAQSFESRNNWRHEIFKGPISLHHQEVIYFACFVLMIMSGQQLKMAGEVYLELYNREMYYLVHHVCTDQWATIHMNPIFHYLAHSLYARVIQVFVSTFPKYCQWLGFHHSLRQCTPHSVWRKVPLSYSL